MGSHEKLHSFVAILENMDPQSDTAYISIPREITESLGGKGRIKVVATFDDHPYRGTLVNMGTGSQIIGVIKDVRKAIQKRVGDRVRVTIEADTEERTVPVPDDLERQFRKYSDAKVFFDKLSYTNRKEYVRWIEEAKKPETRAKRLAQTIQKLKSGRKNPSEKS